MLDEECRKILRHWQRDAGQKPSQLAQALGMSLPRLTRRMDEMRANGVLRGQKARIDWKKLGFAVEVSLRITLDKTQSRAFDEFMEAARLVAQVTEMQTFLGRVDVRLTVIARDMADYQQLYRDQILTLPHIADIEALMQVAQVFEREVLPL